MNNDIVKKTTNTDGPPAFTEQIESKATIYLETPKPGRPTLTELSTDIVDEMLRLVPPARFIKEDIDGKRDVAIFRTDKITFVHKILSRKVTTIKERWKRQRQQDSMKTLARKTLKKTTTLDNADQTMTTTTTTTTAEPMSLVARMPIATDSETPTDYNGDHPTRENESNIDMNLLMTTIRNLGKVVSDATGVDIVDDIDYAINKIKQNRENNDDDERKPTALKAGDMESPFDDKSDIEVRRQTYASPLFDECKPNILQCVLILFVSRNEGTNEDKQNRNVVEHSKIPHQCNCFRRRGRPNTCQYRGNTHKIERRHSGVGIGYSFGSKWNTQIARSNIPNKRSTNV